MKKIVFLLISLFLVATPVNTQNTYANLWEKVTQLENDNLSKSALKQVEVIFAKAEEENNNPQLIKTLFYKSKYALILEEEAQLKIINNFNRQINKSSFPTKNVLENILANLYWQYFKQNRWRFYQRTKTAESVTADFRTWDLSTLFTEIHKNYQCSLEDQQALQKIAINEFATILKLDKETKKYRPTLYDFLAHNALEFYKTPENNITKPTYQFIIDKPNLLSNSKTFTKLKLTTKDTLSLQFNALKIYQNLITFHLQKNNLTALVDVDLQRLEYVNRYATFTNKQALFLKTLKNSLNSYKNEEAGGLYAYKIAEIYTKQAASYNVNTNKNNRFKNQEALIICNTILTQHPKSKVAKKCAYLKDKILQKEVSITAEKFIPINKNSRFLITYKNLDTLHFYAFKVDKAFLAKYKNTYKDSEKIALLNTLPKVNSWTSYLRNENDYLEHSTEIIAPKLAQGIYLIVASENTKITKNAIFGTTEIQVTDLALVKTHKDGIFYGQVVNRNNGRPIPNAKVNLKNYPTNNYNKPINKNFTTNTNGFFSYKSNANHNAVVITVKNTQDMAYFGNFYLYKHQEKKPANTKKRTYITPFTFTDRSIYRPGQTVYFKTIVVQQEQAITKALASKYVTVTLRNVNGQELNKLTLKLNEFGSVAGKFTLPNNGLTGMFSIQVTEPNKNKPNKTYYFQKGYHSFSVEEYKRPKFKTEFKPITGTYRVNDTVTVNGLVTSFAGTNITGAKVVYSVRRKTQYPNWWYRSYVNRASQEITYGEGITDAKGAFKIHFEALPDTSIAKENQPIFIYEVTAAVTDVNGETRSATTNVKIAHHTLVTNIEIPKQISIKEEKVTATITTENLNGIFVPKKGLLKIYKLQAPKNPLRKRPWNAPDYQEIPKEKFRELFPNDAYTDEENNYQTWKKGTMVTSIPFNTKKSKEISIKNAHTWKTGEGKYVAIIKTKDKFGQEVIAKSYFTLSNLEGKKVIDNTLLTVHLDKKEYRIGNNAILQISSASKNITVVVEIERNNQVTTPQLIHLNNEVKTLEIPIKKEDVGGFAIKYYGVNYNAFKNGAVIVNVPEKAEKITIKTKTFRDKLQPNQQENWSFTIENDSKNKIAAEVLASMYDTSLDEFKPHKWEFNVRHQKKYYSHYRSNANQSFGNNRFQITNNKTYYPFPSQTYTTFNWFGFYFSSAPYLRKARFKSGVKVDAVEEIVIESTESDEVEENSFFAINLPSSEKEKKLAVKTIPIRKNLEETAFFFPQLQTNTKGDVSFTFTTPEALTSWKLQLLAHTKDLKTTTKVLTAVTQKKLMVLPNAPRFLREGDTLVFSAKIANISAKDLKGKAQLVLTNAITGKDIGKILLAAKSNENQNFTVDKEGNTKVDWTLIVPENLEAVQYKIIVTAGKFSDGEQNILPVLSNRKLITETLPLWVHSGQTKTFNLTKLKNTKSATLTHHKLTLEVTTNPAWYAVQALPYLMEYPYQCAEQTFAKYYANSLAGFMVQENPKIKQVFDSWKSSDALLSNLEKNNDLKSLLIQETPWLRDAQSETEQKKRIALLFDLNALQKQQKNTLIKLQEMQFSNGGFPWFKGSNYPNVFITNYIVSGFGHLQKLGAFTPDGNTQKMLIKAIDFLDAELVKQHQKIIKQAKNIKLKEGTVAAKKYLEKNHLNYLALNYLYMRSFYPTIPIQQSVQKAVKFYKKQSVTYWKEVNLYGKAQIALTQFRGGNPILAHTILRALEENSITSEELGMYWKNNVAGYYHYQAPIETQSLLIEAFSEITDNNQIIDNLKVWLLKNKQVTQWKTTKATAKAIYALLLKGSNWLALTDEVTVKLGDLPIIPSKTKNTAIETGTGYFKTSWNTLEITPEMSAVTISKKGKGIAWGGLYWQYFEDLDKVTASKTALKIKKNTYLKVHTAKGKELKRIINTTPVKVGDLLTVRIELTTDRDMEFVHLKDVRASGIEPVNVLSKYKWQDGLGYYESTKDAATHFFFDYLPKGIYVFEYDIRVNSAGNFSNGITTIENMYAPEFSSHSKGIRLKVTPLQ